MASFGADENQRAVCPNYDNQFPDGTSENVATVPAHLTFDNPIVDFFPARSIAIGKFPFHIAGSRWQSARDSQEPRIGELHSLIWIGGVASGSGKNRKHKPANRVAAETEKTAILNQPGFRIPPMHGKLGICPSKSRTSGRNSWSPVRRLRIRIPAGLSCVQFPCISGSSPSLCDRGPSQLWVSESSTRRLVPSLPCHADGRHDPSSKARG